MNSDSPESSHSSEIDEPPSEATQSLALTYRDSLLGREYSYELGEAALIITSGDQRQPIPYAQITQIRLCEIRENRLRPLNHLCTITLHDRSWIQIGSRSATDASLGEHRMAYRVFVETLHELLMPFKSHISWREGFTWPICLGYISLSGLIASLCVVLAVVLLMEPGRWAVWLLLSLSLTLLYTTLEEIFLNIPQFYDPLHIPAGRLPKCQTQHLYEQKT